MKAEPAFLPLIPEKNDDDLAGHLHRQAIGLLGAALPVFIWILHRRRPTPPLTPTGLDSISAYHWTSGVIAFAGILAAMAAYLIAYDGYGTDDGWKERVGSTLAGVAAACVAIFPTFPPDGIPDPSWWEDSIGRIHYGAAIFFFLTFVYFCWFRFPKSKVEGFPWSAAARKQWDTDKWVRNLFYAACGLGVLVALLLAWRSARSGGSIFWQEVFAVELFALAWLVKGRADRTAWRAAQRAAFGVRHPFKAAQRVGAWMSRS